MIMRPAKNPSSCRIPFSTVGTEVRVVVGGAELHRGNAVEGGNRIGEPLGLLRQLLDAQRDNGGPLARPAQAVMTPPPRMKLPSCGMIRCDHDVGALRRAR